VCTHCNCMAGAGEACSHIAALLYTVMTGVRIKQETAVTSQRCQWLEATGAVCAHNFSISSSSKPRPQRWGAHSLAMLHLNSISIS